MSAVKLYTIREFAEQLGVSLSTLRAWDRSGKLVALRTPTGKRRYTEEMLYRALGLKRREEPRKVVLRKGFLKLCGMVLRGEVRAAVVAYKDRLVRFGFEFFEELFARFGCELLVVNRAEEASPAQW